MNIKTTFSRWAKYQQTVRELNELSNRELNDLGIERHEIAKLAREASTTF